jgi:hypothetical protein
MYLSRARKVQVAARDTAESHVAREPLYMRRTCLVAMHQVSHQRSCAHAMRAAHTLNALCRLLLRPPHHLISTGGWVQLLGRGHLCGGSGGGDLHIRRVPSGKP